MTPIKWCAIALLVFSLCISWYATKWQYMQSLGVQAASSKAACVACSSNASQHEFSQSLAGSPVGLSAAFLRSCAELMDNGGVYIYPTDALAPLPTLLPGRSDHSLLFPYSDGESIDPLQQYGLEVMLIRALQNSPYVTNDPSKAKIFLVPQYATLETHYCLYAISPTPDNRLHDCAANVSKAYLLPIIQAVQASPWYMRRNGSDHFWIFSWDASWNLFPGVPEALASNHYFGYIGSAANLVAVPVTARFAGELEDAERNIILGGTSDRGFMAESLRHPHSLHICSALPPHKYLASFAGTVWPTRTYSQGLRQDLLEKFPLARAEQTGIAFIDRHMEVAEYRQLLRDSIFCLSPQGWTPWSQRLFFAISMGCIPVSLRP